MNEHIGQAIERSSEDFLRLVWPAIGGQFGEVIPVETVTANLFAAELDRRSGIDVWLLGVGRRDIRGLASRVQWPRGEPFDTFSVRVRSRNGGLTEYDKRKREIASNGASIRPYYVAQGYVRCTNPNAVPMHRTCADGDHPRLLSAAIARMADVIAAVDLDLGRLMPPNTDGSQGYAVPWSRLSVIHRWPPPEQGELFGEAS